jgi:hypothetical protein
MEAVAVLGCLAVFLLVAAPRPAVAEARLGGGVNYWRTIDDLEDEGFDDVDESGLSYLLTYQYVPGGLLRFEVDLEYFDEGFGGATSGALSPQAYLLLGSGFYAGLGIGVTYSDDFEDEFSDPFYAAKLGVDLELLPNFHLDIHANYRFDAWRELEEADTDTVFLGAAVRFGF